MSQRAFRNFCCEATALQGSVTPQVMPHVLACGAWALVVCVVHHVAEQLFPIRVAMEVGPHEVGGAILALLLILRTNAGYDRWWEARKLWGGIVNQSRNFVITALSYGPADLEWRGRLVRWASAFPHVARASLRGERPCCKVEALLGSEAAAQLAAADHMPSFVAWTLAVSLRDCRDRHGMDDFAFLQADRERALLIDHIGACERILRTPLPKVYAINIRRFMMLFLLTLPFALLHKLGNDWLVPLVTMLVAYPLMSLDQIGIELQNPFAATNLSHLPLDDICTAIERNLGGILSASGVSDDGIDDAPLAERDGRVKAFQRRT